MEGWEQAGDRVVHLVAVGEGAMAGDGAAAKQAGEEVVRRTSWLRWGARRQSASFKARGRQCWEPMGRPEGTAEIRNAVAVGGLRGKVRRTERQTTVDGVRVRARAWGCPGEQRLGRGSRLAAWVQLSEGLYSATRMLIDWTPYGPLGGTRLPSSIANPKRGVAGSNLRENGSE